MPTSIPHPSRPVLKASAVLFLAGISGFSAGAGTIDPAARYAYDANAGWIDFAPTPSTAVTVGDHFLSGYAYSANYAWIHFGNGAPANGYSYPAGVGVNVDSVTAELSGNAYAANIGWIRFGWAGPNDPNRPRVNPGTGQFAGSVYAPNVGWISLGGVRTTTLALTDSDGDGMSDAWEREFFGNLTTAGVGTDWDKDGQSDAAEYAAGTLPKQNASWLKITSHSVNTAKTQTTLTFTTVPGRRYRVQTSTDLVTWTPVVALSEFPGTPGATSTTVLYSHAAGGLRFHRVVARPY